MNKLLLTLALLLSRPVMAEPAPYLDITSTNLKEIGFVYSTCSVTTGKSGRRTSYTATLEISRITLSLADGSKVSFAPNTGGGSFSHEGYGSSEDSREQACSAAKTDLWTKDSPRRNLEILESVRSGQATFDEAGRCVKLTLRVFSPRSKDLTLRDIHLRKQAIACPSS